MTKSLSEKGKSTITFADKLKLHTLIWGSDVVTLEWMNAEINRELCKRSRHDKKKIVEAK